MDDLPDDPSDPTEPKRPLSVKYELRDWGTFALIGYYDTFEEALGHVDSPGYALDAIGEDGVIETVDVGEDLYERALDQRSRGNRPPLSPEPLDAIEAQLTPERREQLRQERERSNKLMRDFIALTEDISS